MMRRFRSNDLGPRAPAISMTNDSCSSGPPYCQQFQDALQQFLDGGQGEFSAELQLHRAGCADCLSRFHAAVLLRSALPLMPDFKLSDNWTRATSAALLADSSPSSVRLRANWKVGALAALAATLLLA